MPGQNPQGHTLPEPCHSRANPLQVAWREEHRPTDTEEQGTVYSSALERSRAHVEKTKAINAELRRIINEMRQEGLIP